VGKPHLVLRADDIRPFTIAAAPGYHSQHILGSETAGTHDTLLNRGTVLAGYSLPGGNHPDNDEIYYIVSGDAELDLDGDPDTGVGCRSYRVEAGMVVFIPAGTFHRLRNDSDTDLVILAVWPQPAKFGANGIHDERLKEWGTGFRLRDGRELRTEGTASRVVEPDASWDPLVL
jgi:mannose-6-phosphate isomerase-like protein (cupin superfamily)